MPLHQTLSPVTYNHALSYLSKENVRIIDLFEGNATAARVVKERIKKIHKWVGRCLADIDDVSNFVALKEDFSELLMFVKLAEQYSIESIPRESKPTPDFRVRFHRQELFLEMKALNILDTEANHKAIMQAALQCKIEVERQRKEGRQVASSLFVIQPYRTINYDPDSTTAVVETLIEKVDQNIDEEQFTRGITLLLLDFSEQLQLHGSAGDNLSYEFATGPDYVPQSGELWHLAFGRTGAQMKRVVDFRGQNHLDRPLTRNGVLRKYDFVAGLIVHYANEFWGAAFRRRNNVAAVRFLEEFCTECAIENA